MADEKGDHKSVDNSVSAEEVNGDHNDEVDSSPDFVPIVSLPEVAVRTMEEEEEEMVKLRAKLFRYDTHESPPEWKERGIGDIKLLRHTVKNCCRVVMRRDKTFKVCANHYITPWMELKPNCGSDRAWVYSVPADYANEQIRPELLAIRFGSAENAQKWKDTFEEAKKIVLTQCSLYSSDAPSGDENDDSESTENEDDDDEKEGNKSREESGMREVSEQLEKLSVATTEVASGEKSEKGDDH